MAVEPVINGLRVGGLVELCDLGDAEISVFEKDVNGEWGQIVTYAGGDIGKFYVQLLSGGAGYVDPKNLKALVDLRPPGEDGSDDKSFDIIMSSRTDDQALGFQISTCMMEKGFCVIRVCQTPQLMEIAMAKLKEMGDDGYLSRLPEEVEEHYLGANFMGKVKWFDPNSPDLGKDQYLNQCDDELSHVAEVFQPYSCDILGNWLDERSPALVAVSLTDDEVPEYPIPEADDEVLGKFLKTWRRTLLKAVHFAGPLTTEISLSSVGGDAAGKLPKVQAGIDLACAPGTILLFRPDVYECSCQAPSDETLMLVTYFLTPPDKFSAPVLEGDTDWIAAPGPPPPLGVKKHEHVYVTNTVERLPSNWDNQWAYYAGLGAGCDTVIKIPFMRWDVDIYFNPNPDMVQEWQTATRHQSFCEGAEYFDNRHFEISNAEGAGLDPVMRLTLEAGCQSLALEGITKKMTNRKSYHAGFCVGNDKLDWATLPKEIAVGGAMGGTSMNLAILANRFNFTFNLKGPSFVCDTACSASLTSTHCAKRCVLDRDNDPLDFFITMGSHLCLANGPFIGGSQAHMNTSEGRCFTFNASADGYLRGEGIVGFMMKYGSREDYHNNSDAILRATQLGQDGRSASLTAPNGPAQEEMIRRAIKEAQMTAPESTVWECHGTGTTLGDPIEVGAVRKVQIRMKRLEPLMMGSVKSNMGHLEGSAAMGGLVKCILQCKNTMCTCTLHVRTLNPHLEHAAFEAVFMTEVSAYTYFQGHCQVSSFGFGGANGHGIFWGRNLDAQPDVKKLWNQKLSSRPAPQVRVMGKDPDEWEADFPDMRACKTGAKFSVTFGPETPEDETVVWKLEQDGPDEDEEDDETFYAITGNFNDWQDDRMVAGDVVGSFNSLVEIPESGTLEFRILKDAETSQVIAPATNNCTRKSEKIEGPKEGLTNKWVVQGQEGQEVEVVFFARRGMMSIMWVVAKSYE